MSTGAVSAEDASKLEYLITQEMLLQLLSFTCSVQERSDFLCDIWSDSADVFRIIRMLQNDGHLIQIATQDPRGDLGLSTRDAEEYLSILENGHNV